MKRFDYSSDRNAIVQAMTKMDAGEANQQSKRNEALVVFIEKQKQDNEEFSKLAGRIAGEGVYDLLTAMIINIDAGNNVSICESVNDEDTNKAINSAIKKILEDTRIKIIEIQERN